ncbi:MAG TPA: hypothetical protein PKH79_08770 [Prolixibacteraceae bacterium]|nr:hypothetical protein [Prolixibacteraceae bacterium]
MNDKGLDQQFISKLEEEINIINSLNKEIDALKAEAKVKSKEANLKAIDAKMQVKQAKRIIKQDFDPTQWKDFGIQDRR